MEQKTNTRGGARPGSGRKMGKEQKVTISFRVTATTRDRIQKLREDGVDVNKHLEMMVALLASPKTHREFVCGGPRTGKSFQAMIEAAMGEGRKSNPQTGNCGAVARRREVAEPYIRTAQFSYVVFSFCGA